MHSALSTVQIAPVDKTHLPLALGGSIFGGNERMHQIKADLVVTMEAALQQGVTHFDTASSYAAGRSEELIGQFLGARREQVFLASKAGLDEMDAGLMLAEVDKSRQRLQTDVIDLYYIHWPRSNKDLRPLMEGLELARTQGKIRAIGVSNFSVEQMRQVSQAGQINAHQFCYNLLWRFDEAEVIPYCRQNNIALVAYSSIAQGVLTGKFPRYPQLRPDDQRARTVHFEEAVWPHVYAAVEQLKLVAHDANRPLAHLALRWVLHQPGITVAVAGAITPQQVIENAQALDGEIPREIFQRMSAISDEVMQYIPNPGNPYRYKP